MLGLRQALVLALVAGTALPDFCPAQLVPNLGGQRAGISSMQFLKIGVGARGAAMGESFVAVADDPSALYWNPAGITLFPQNAVFVAHTRYVVDIRHEYAGIVQRLSSSDVLGVTVTALHMDDMEITTETMPQGTGRYFTFGDVGAGITYARQMTDQFSFGTTLRYVEETLDVLSMRAFMVDLGTLYRTGLGSVRFAVVIANFGGDVSPSGSRNERQSTGGRDSNYQSFSLPTVFKLGAAFEPLADENQRLTASIQLNHPNDNSEHVRVGLEYAWDNTLFLRGGVKRTIGQPVFGADGTSSEDFSFGFGVRARILSGTVSADYGLSNFSLLGGVHRLSLSVLY